MLLCMPAGTSNKHRVQMASVKCLMFHDSSKLTGIRECSDQQSYQKQQSAEPLRGAAGRALCGLCDVQPVCAHC